MKNIHVLPTDKPSRLVLDVNKNLSLAFNKSIEENAKYRKHIYITSDEEIKEGDWIFNKEREPSIIQCIGKGSLRGWKKIVLTTDQDLIKDGVQEIDDEFLEWFVRNPSCEKVQILWTIPAYKIEKEYRIEIPKEKPKPHSFCETPKVKCTLNYCDENGCLNRVRHLVEPNQETIEEAAEKQWGNVHRTGVLAFIDGAKLQAERMYNEEEVIVILEQAMKDCHTEGLDMHYSGNYKYLKDWFEQFKKK